MTVVTDATFPTAVLERSKTVPVVVDLWATWCGPCRTLSPIIEKVIAETGGSVELATVDVDANPRVAQAFGVQSIPSVFALRDGEVVDSFVGALPEHAVREWVGRLAPGASRLEELVARGDEASLREAHELDPDNADVAARLGELWRQQGRLEEAEQLLTPFERTVAAATVLARVRLERQGVVLDGDVDLTLDHLLEQSATDEQARTNLLTVLDALGPEDPRYLTYRRRLMNRLH